MEGNYSYSPSKKSEAIILISNVSTVLTPTL